MVSVKSIFSSPVDSERQAGRSSESELTPLRDLGLAFGVPLASILLMTDGGRSLMSQVAEQYRATFQERPPLVESAHHFCESVSVSESGELCATNLSCLGRHLGIQPIGASYQVQFPERYSLETTLLRRDFDNGTGTYTYEFGSGSQVQLIISSHQKLCPIPFELSPNEVHRGMLTFLQGASAKDRGTAVRVQVFNSHNQLRPLEANATLERLYLED